MKENKVYYNEDNKIRFLETISNKSYEQVFERIFRASRIFEEYFNKDLYCFTKEDLLSFLTSFSKGKKYTTIYTYNSLIADYKNWAKSIGVADVVEGICPANMLKTIKYFDQYLILNDEDVDNLTKYEILDGADYNCAIILRTLWETNGYAELSDILNIKIEDLNAIEKTLEIGGIEYTISDWLISAIEEFASLDYLEFKNKKGCYKILTSEENNGYIFRVALTRNTKVGIPLTVPYVSNLMHQYSRRKKIGQKLTINDIKMSLALKYMLKHKKTHSEMYSNKIYFTNLPSKVYAIVFECYGKEKFPKLYNEYIEYFKNLNEKLLS